MEINVNVKEKGKTVENFWNCVHFHPTDAIEDDWGKAVIERISSDNAASFMRIYAMLEDIVTVDESGNLSYDFSEGDYRMDYLIGKGFDLLVCINFMPDAIASEPQRDIGIPRYKGKRVNNSVPKSYSLWEEVCYRYAMHLISRYGIERLKNWRFHCWNEPDHEYWVSSENCFKYLERNGHDKLDEYIKLYDSFERAFFRASPQLKVGGPSAAFCADFIRGFVNHIAESGTRLDFVTVHAYADLPYEGTNGKITPSNIKNVIKVVDSAIKEAGLEKKEIIVDEWGAAAGGFLSIKKNPLMELRENEFFPAFYFRLIDLLMHADACPSKMLLCLSGQHKSKFDFDGYRSFFTKSGFAKPIYNGFVLSAKLGTTLLKNDGENCISTVDPNGNAVVALYNGGENPSDNPGTETVQLNIEGLEEEYNIRKSVINAYSSNSYGYWKSIGSPENLTGDLIKKIDDMGNINTTDEGVTSGEKYSSQVTLNGNCVVLIELTRRTGTEA